MKQKLHTAINWLDYEQLKVLLNNHGIDVSPSESENDLREAVRANVMDGEISEEEIEDAKM